MSSRGMQLSDVAARLGCSYRHIRRLVRLYIDTDGDGGLEATPVGIGQRLHYRVSEEQLQRYLARQQARR